MESEGADSENSMPIDSQKKVEEQNHTPIREEASKRETVWDQFTLCPDKSGRPRGKCKNCGRTYPADRGTSKMSNHMKACKNYIYADDAIMEESQTIQSLSGSAGGVDQEAIEKALARMIIIDGLSLFIVTKEGFREFISALCPEFVIPSVVDLAIACYKLYLDEKEKLTAYFRTTGQRVSLTTDMWTSEQGLKYLCLTAHYIDDDWKLHKSMLNFILCPSQKGDEVGVLIEKCLLEWGIDKIFSITVDNASCSDATVDYLRGRFVDSGAIISGGKFLHMRNVAHIVNLVVRDRLEEIKESVERVRAVVKCVMERPNLLKKFHDEKIEGKKSLYLDIPTKWNSTYTMLKTALIFKGVFERYADEEYDFFVEFMEGGFYANIGTPTKRDWIVVEKFVKVLHYFQELTLRLSGSLSVTSNTFFDEITDVVGLLNEWLKKDDDDLVDMVKEVKIKFEKYWGDLENTNMMLYVAAMLDPRFKFRYVEFVLKKCYGLEDGEKIANLAKGDFNDLFEEYKNLYSLATTTATKCESEKDDDDDDDYTRRWARRKKFQQMMWEASLSEPELDNYLQERNEKPNPDFDSLDWWKSNGPRFPVLSGLARDVLAVPVSTMSLDSGFSVGECFCGPVLDELKGMLPYEILEALICCQNWIRPTPMNSLEESRDYMQTIEEDMASKSTIFGY